MPQFPALEYPFGLRVFVTIFTVRKKGIMQNVLRSAEGMGDAALIKLTYGILEHDNYE